MAGLLDGLGALINLLTVVIGFGLIIMIHELGHFLAARWAGIRVLTFAIGFGPPLLSYRRGMGWRRGSTAAEYERLINAESDIAGDADPSDGSRRAISHTEYRLAALPLGGYVRMLGQDDLDPMSVSDAPDSYQRAPVWKRMVVISAGVVFNIISAAALFVAVFMIGIKSAPPVVGATLRGSPAENARVVAGPEGTEPGLRGGDRIVAVNGEIARTFPDVMMSLALAERGRSVEIKVERPGVDRPIVFSAIPEASDATGLLSVGVAQATTLTLLDDDDVKGLRPVLDRLGLEGVPPGSTVVSVNGSDDLHVGSDLARVFAESDGAPVQIVFEAPGGERVTKTVAPTLEPQVGEISVDGSVWPIAHALGLTPVMTVSTADDPTTTKDDPKQGLKPGDAFARIGSIEYPSLIEGLREIRSRRGEAIELETLRGSTDGGVELVKIDAQVTRKGEGQVGFLPASDLDVPPILAATPRGLEADGPAFATDSIDLRPGTRILEVEGSRVDTMQDVLVALRRAAIDGADDVALLVAPPLTVEGAVGEPRTVRIDLDESDRVALTSLAWNAPFSTAIFKPSEKLLKAEHPLEAITIGLHETRRIAVSVYVQFARLFQGSVKIEHIKGPVGIAHVGTLVAAKGPVWLMFFLAMISVNLAVINFLPLPVVDGGQFLMLLYEQLRGRPVPIGVQNAVTMAGLALIAGVFLVATFNDVRSLLGL